MIAEITLLGIDVPRDWLDGFCLPGQQRFRHPNSADGHIALIAMIQRFSGPVKVGFEATGGQEWRLWTELSAAGIVAVQLPPAQIKAFALSRGTRAKTDRIDHCPAGACEACCREGRNSSPGSWHSDRKPGENCQMKICVFSEL